MRWLLVRGVDGRLVHDPFVDANPRRFVGKAMLDMHHEDVKKRLAELDGDHHERFENVEQIVKDDPWFRAEIADGALVMIAECVAKTHAQAVVKMAAAKTEETTKAKVSIAPKNAPITVRKDGDL